MGAPCLSFYLNTLPNLPFGPKQSSKRRYSNMTFLFRMSVLSSIIDQSEDPRRPGVPVDPFTEDCSHRHHDLCRSHVVDVSSASAALHSRASTRA